MIPLHKYAQKPLQNYHVIWLMPPKLMSAYYLLSTVSRMDRYRDVYDYCKLLEGKYSLESTDLRKSEIRAHLHLQFSVEWVELRISYLFIMHQVISWFVYIGKSPQFTAFLDSNLHTGLAIVTENEPGLAFPPRNLPKKFRPDPSTFYLVIVVTNRQTNRQTERQTKQCRWLHNPSQKLSLG